MTIMPVTENRDMLIKMLMGNQPQYQGVPTSQAFGNAIGQLGSAMVLGKALKENKAQKSYADKNLAQALMTMQGTKPGLDPSTGINWDQGRKADYEGGLSMLLQNENTAPLGQELFMNDFKSKKDIESAVAKARALAPIEIDIARQKKGIEDQLSPYDQFRIDSAKKQYELEMQKLQYDKNNPQKPAAIQEFEYYQALPEDQKQAFIMNKSGFSPDSKPLPATVVKLQNETLDDINTASNIEADLNSLATYLESGNLDLGPVNNMGYRIQNWAGKSSDTSRNFATMKSTLEKMRNDSLRLNKGVQTEGDAVRAWNELFENINDENLVSERLRELQGINRRAADMKKLQLDNIRANYGAPPMDFNQFQAESPLSGLNNNPQNGDEALFEHMTPEERALFGR